MAIESIKGSVEAKVQAWVTSVEKLVTAAESQAQAAYAALSIIDSMNGPICNEYY